MATCSPTKIKVSNLSTLPEPTQKRENQSCDVNGPRKLTYSAPSAKGRTEFVMRVCKNQLDDVDYGEDFHDALGSCYYCHLLCDEEIADGVFLNSFDSRSLSIRFDSIRFDRLLKWLWTFKLIVHKTQKCCSFQTDWGKFKLLVYWHQQPSKSYVCKHESCQLLLKGQQVQDRFEMWTDQLVKLNCRAVALSWSAAVLCKELSNATFVF